MQDVIEKAGNSLNLDQSHWQLVKFGDVAIQQKQSVDRENTELTRYVKGEHMGSEDLHLRKWGELADEYLGPAFIRKFEDGDILYGSRRTYLRKVVIAPFDGITSNTTFVIKANEDKIDRRLLPFVMLSEGFAQHSIRNSKGSVNPYVNWKDLAGYEFLLPPKAQQAELAELLWALDEVVELQLEIGEKLTDRLHMEIESRIHGLELAGLTINQAIGKLSARIAVHPLSNLGEIFKGKGIRKSEVMDAGVPCVRYGELYTQHHRIIREFSSFISEDSAGKSVKIQPNDILFAGSGETIAEIGKSAAYVGQKEAYAGSDIVIFRPADNSMDGAYLGYLMNSIFVRQQLNKLGTGATVMHIYTPEIGSVRIPVRPKHEQISIRRSLEEIYKNIRLAEAKRLRSQMLLKTLINQIF